MDDLEEVFMDSRTVIVVLSQGFLNEKFSRWELTQALYHEIEQDNFKVILILMKKMRELTEAPKKLKAFLRLGTSVRRNDGQFWNKLVYELNHHTRSNSCIVKKNTEWSNQQFVQESCDNECIQNMSDLVVLPDNIELGQR